MSGSMKLGVMVALKTVLLLTNTLFKHAKLLSKAYSVHMLLYFSQMILQIMMKKLNREHLIYIPSVTSSYYFLVHTWHNFHTTTCAKQSTYAICALAKV